MGQLVAHINPIFEAIHYIMNKVNGVSADQVMKNVIARHPHIKQLVTELWMPAISFEKAMDDALSVSELKDNRYFRGITSFPTMFCLATVLLEPVSYFGFITDIDELKDKLLAMDDDERINHTISSIGDTEADGSHRTYKEFIDTVIALNITDSEKMSIIAAYNDYETSINDVIELIRPFAECAAQNQTMLADSIASWEREINGLGSLEGYINDKYHFTIPKGNYTIFPTFMNCLLMNHYFWRNEEGEAYGELLLSPGMVRYNDALLTHGNVSRIVGILKGLADETRFELLKYINRESSYGNALADKFNMTQQKVFYHMLRMQTPNIVECNAQNGKTYYTINKRTIRELINALEEFAGDDDQSETK